MKVRAVVLVLLLGIFPISTSDGAAKKSPGKTRIMVVSSYHQDYLWSQESNRGFCEAMRKFGYFASDEQAKEYTADNYVETPRVIVKKMWMDAKRKAGRVELAKIAGEITAAIRTFRPHLIFLGDDEAGNYIGSQFLDTAIPVVFWGFNDSPVKYGLVDTAERPGHNVTGVYQSGYYLESMQLLTKLVPEARTVAILTDDSPSGRAHQKGVEFLARKNALPLKLTEAVATNSYEQWQRKALELQNRADAFFVAQYSALKNEKGDHIANTEVARWYRENIRIPEATLGFFVRHGLLCGADDSGYNQAYEAVEIAQEILTKGKNPATYPTRTPKRGALLVNRERARMLGIVLTERMGIEEYVDGALPARGP